MAGFVSGLELDEGSLTKAVVSTIGELDSPMLPDAQGMAGPSPLLALAFLHTISQRHCCLLCACESP